MEWECAISNAPQDGAEVLLSRADGLRVVATFHSGRGLKVSEWRWPLGRNAECCAKMMEGDMWARIPPRPIKREEEEPYDDGDPDDEHRGAWDPTFPY